MKVGRNDPCPCGSGRKYKKCCLNKDEMQRLAVAIVDSTHNIKNYARIKQCLHPNKQECNGGIAHAHAIQKNGPLTKIAENGEVVTMDGVSYQIFQTNDVKGKKIATTFTGFCKYHDKVLFQEIEDKEFVCSPKQIFLLTYRTMAWHYHKKMEQVKATEIVDERMEEKGYSASANREHIEYLDHLDLGVKDVKSEKEIFDKALLSEEYSVVSYSVWEIPYEVEFAVSMMHELEYDLLGNRINDFEKDDILKQIYLNIFPVSEKTLCVWSWLNSNDFVYKPFSSQFMKLKIDERENYLNNKLPRWSNSLVISPRLWEKWGDGIQMAFITHANFDSLYRELEEEQKLHAYSYMETPWNLFENLSIK